MVAIGTPLRLLRVFPDLVWGFGRGSAIDLKARYLEVQTWFAGLPVYGGAVHSADYPPASYATLWPFLGWLPLAQARWLWAATILIGLGCLAYAVTRADKAATTSQWLFVALLPFAVYPTTANIVLGQLTIHCLASLMAGLLLLHSGQGRWWEDALAAGLFIVALAKPTVSGPFFWLVLFLPGRLRPSAFVLLGYAALTLFAASFQDASLLELLKGWRGQESQISVHEGHANLSGWLLAIGFKKAILPAALLTLLALGAWVWRHRKVDFWLLAGVTGLVTRLCVHHRAQDDLLILLPMIALMRLAKQAPALDGADVTAGLLFALTWMTMLAPVDLLLRIPALRPLMAIWLGVLWLTTLLFLLGQARKERMGNPGRALQEPSIHAFAKTPIEA
ncbi:MAG: glycosyltransferase family 87 protein [Blastocatellales bacterium]